MILPLYLVIASVTANSISIISCLTFFYFYLKGPRHSLGLQMILILCSADLIFHISYLLLFVTNSIEVLNIAGDITGWALRLSVFWACNISFLLYTLFKMDQLANLSKYFRVSLFLLIFLNLVLTLIGKLLEDEPIFAFVITLIGPACIAILLCVYFYSRIAKLLKKNPFLSEILNTTPSKLYIYSALQLGIAVPSIICFVLMVLTDEAYFPFQAVISVMLGLAGFLNSMVYFFCRMNAVNLSFNKGKSSEVYLSVEISRDSVDKSLAMPDRQETIHI